MPLDFQLNCTTVAIQGFAISATPPEDNQVLTWDNAAENWIAEGTQIPDTVLNYKGLVADTGALPAAPGNAVGDTYYVAGSTQFYMWNGTEWTALSPPLNTVSFPEAPIDGQTYGRDGALADWNPVLALSGGTLTGTLILSGDPDPAGDPNQAVTLNLLNTSLSDLNNELQGDIVDAMQAASQWLGTYDATGGFTTYNPQNGFTNGALVNPNQVPGAFVICTIAGTIPSGPLAGTAMLVGDWLYSDGANWIPIHIAGTGSGGGGGPVTAADVSLSPVVGTWTNVQQAIMGLAPIDSPILTGDPQSPNPPIDDDSTSIATTSWVNAAIAAYVDAWATANGVLTDVTTSGDVTSA